MKILKYSFIVLITIILTGCGATREPLVPQAVTGVKMSKEWKEFNKNAKENNSPQLDYFATTINIPSKKGMGIIHDNIKNYGLIKFTDKAIYQYAKFHNLSTNDNIEIRTLMPDGREYDYNSYKYKSNTSQLWVWDRTFIKDEFAIKYPGTWKVELYINGKYLMSKKFTLEFDKKYEIVKPNINIGVTNFRSKKLSRYKIGSGIGEYLAHGILDSNKNIKVVHPKEMKRYQPNMQIPEEKYEATILADISSSESQILEYAFKHKLDYVISGLAKASVESNSFDIEIESYLLDVKSKKLIAKKKTVHAVSLNQARQISLSKAWRSEYNKAVKMNLNELTPILKGL